MSQLQLRDDSQYTADYQHYHSGDRLISDQNQQQPYPNNLSTTYDPNSKRAIHQAQSTSDIRSTSQRKPAPAPLRSFSGSSNHSTLSQSTTAGSDRNNSLPFPRPPGINLQNPSRSDLHEGRDPPASPREKLDKLLATEGYHYTGQEAQPSPKFSISGPLDEVGSSSRENAQKQLKSSNADSTSAGLGQSTGTKLAISSSMPSSSSSQRLETRPIPRTSSIDTAISSIASQSSSSQKSTQENTVPSSADIANLISTAGSPEAVIQYLLKEKNATASQNTQLWRLVDKQRAMILGLNKDLERALKDKERYRKKLKEHLSQVPPIPAGASDAALSIGRADSESPAPREPHGEYPVPGGSVHELITKSFARNDSVTTLGSERTVGSDRDREGHDSSPTDISLAPYPITPPTNQTIVSPRPLKQLNEADHRMPSPSEHALNGRDNSSSFPLTIESKENEARRVRNVLERIEVKTDVPAASLPNSSASPRSFTARLSAGSAQMMFQHPPTVAVTAPTPMADKGEKAHQAPRKPPPAPLDLAQPIFASSHLYQSNKDATKDDGHSDSDYDDILEVDEIPAFERGRRKTREEDDREREIAAQNEKEARSRSKKEKAKKAASQSRPQETADPIPIKGAAPSSQPPSPPQPAPLSRAAAQMRHLSPPDSLASILNQSNTPSDVGMSSQNNSRFISPPPMSPGLPLSPGLPRSPRPVDRPMVSPTPRLPKDGMHFPSMASPPLSPRMGMGFPGLPLSPRQPRASIPFPPNTPMSVASPGLPRNDVLTLSSPQPLFAGYDRSGQGKEVVTKSEPSRRSNNSTGTGSPSTLEVPGTSQGSGVYQGLVSDQYPGLLLPPNALPLIAVRVCSSRLKPSRASFIAGNKKPSAEESVFTLGVFARSDNRELWRVEKDIMSLPNLDSQLKQSWDFAARIPDRALFSGHAPARIDARRDALNEYFDIILDTPMDDRTAIVLCQFLTADALDPVGDEVTRDSPKGSSVNSGPGGRPKKEGYLTKRGKNFGGWKARFFTLDGPVLRYYESPGGPHLGSIKLQNAQIGKQSQQQSNHSPNRGESDDPENQYRHAFLILEPKRKDSSSLVRHVLCAESDTERDEWVDALLQYVDYHSSEDDRPKTGHGRKESRESGTKPTGLQAKQRRYAKNSEKGKDSPDQNDEDSLRGVSYEDTVQANAPVYGPSSGQRQSDTPSPPTSTQSSINSGQGTSHSQSSKQISAPTNGAPIQDAESWGNKSRNLLDDMRQKKRSIWGFRGRNSSDIQNPGQQNQAGSTASLNPQGGIERSGQIRAVFGAPLAEAVEYNRLIGIDVLLPAVVYRCIEYLDAKNAASEEGIFRLSGSNVVIKALRERFNTEGDFDFLADDQYYDVHAVASLLKLYLRELPSTVLTRELHLDFLHVLEMDERSKKVAALNGLVHRLPRANWTLLKALSAFLITIINNADVNKMTVRNVGIVFSPTLNIPAPVFSMFLQEYDGIFGIEPDEKTPSPVEFVVTAPSLSPDDIRSPRRQMFSELPTPSYRQDRFQQNQEPPWEQQQRQQLQQQQQQFQQQQLQQQQLQQPPAQYPGYDTRSYDTGFIPLQPSYDQPIYSQNNYGGMQPHGGSLNGAVAYSEAQNSKSRRRESSMLMMMGGQKKGSMPRLNEHGLVGDDSAFD